MGFEQSIECALVSIVHQEETFVFTVMKMSELSWRWEHLVWNLIQW